MKKFLSLALISTLLSLSSYAIHGISGNLHVCVGGTTYLYDTSFGGVWSMSNSHATIGSTGGVVTGISPGLDTVIYVDSGSTVYAVLTVDPLPAPIVGATTICVGATTALADTTAGGHWSSGTCSHITIGSSSGVVTGVSAGTCTVTYTSAAGCTRTIVVTVNPNPIISGGTTVTTGGTLTLTGYPAGGIWSSSTTSVATVGSATGIVTGVSGGATTITYSLPTGCVSTVFITDSGSSVLPAITGPSTVCVGSSTVLSDPTTGGIWTSSNPAVATIGSSSGVVTGITTGVVTITYTVGASTATTSISVNATASISGPSSLCLGTTITLTGTPGGGLWSSGNVAIATVASGLVTGVGAGIVNIYYSSGGCYAYHIVTVSPSPAAITGATTVSVGGTTTLSDAVAGGTWSSSNTSIATINATSGVVTGIAYGTCTITYSIGGCYVTTTISVSGTSIYPILGSSSVCTGSTITLTDPTSGGTWSSSNTSVATVSSVGIVTGISAGTATITYTVGAGYVTKAITVNASPAAIGGTTTTTVGGTATLTDATAGGTWTSSNTTIATINATSGVATGVSAGTCAMTYTLPGGCFARVYFTVTGDSTIAPISGGSAVCTGTTTTLTDATPGGSWSSSNTAIATVSSGGIVTGVSAGTVTITYTVGASYVTHAITVSSGPAAITGPTTTTVGGTVTLSDATAGGTWSSSTPSIATINPTSGVVTGVSAGTCAITYTLPGGCFVRIYFTVTGSSSISPISGPSAVCVGSTITLTDSASGGTWSSSNTAIATVSSAGIVTGISAGTCNITYTLGSSYVIKSVTVTTGASITGASTVCAGSTITLTASLSGGSWVSGNTAIATVSSAGVVTGVAGGVVNIYYSVGGCYAYHTVTVNASATISGSHTVCLGTTTTLSASVSGGSWSSSNTSVATVGSLTGVVSGLTAGTATIYYHIGSCYASYTVTVSTSSSISGGSSVCAGSTLTLTGSPSGGNWFSSNTAVATVGLTTGIVTGVTTGTVTVYYNAGGCYSTHAVTVNSAASISGASLLCGGSTTTLTASPSGGSWTSGNTSVATVGSTGVVTAVGSGVVNIYYSTGGCSAYHTMTVNATASITGASTLCVGTTTTLTASPTGGIWSSSNTSVATVTSSGVVSGIAAGTATIYYLSGGCYTGHPVTVSGTSSISGASTLCAGFTTTLSTSGSGTWNSSNTSVATVSSTGVVTGVGAGTVVIYLTGSCPAYHLMTVNATPVISGGSSVCHGTTITLSGSVSGGVWSSSNTAVATVGSGTGVVSGVSAGTSTIIYTVGGCYATHNVTVNSAASISGASSVCIGGSATLTASPTGGSWSSGNTSIATVTSGGVVTGIAAGTVNIYYNVGGCYAYHIVTVNASSASISGPSMLCAGSSVTLTGSPSGGTWASSYTISATIGTSSGILTGVSGGTSTIYYSVGGCYAYRVETVNPLPATIGGPSSLCVGSYITLTDATSGGTWSSSSTAIATVSTAGTVYGVSAGIATISYTVGSCSVGKNVDVTPAPAPIGGPSSVLVGYAITLLDATAGGTWLSGNTAIATINPTTGVVLGISAGTVNIYYSIGGCTVYTTIVVSDVPLSPIHVSGNTSLNEVTAENLVKVYPNPTSGSLNVQWDGHAGGSALVIITDVTGREVFRSTMDINADSGSAQFDLSNLKDGIYILSIKSDNTNYNGKLIISR